jgi:hypothetical protein
MSSQNYLPISSPPPMLTSDTQIATPFQQTNPTPLYNPAPVYAPQSMPMPMPVPMAQPVFSGVPMSGNMIVEHEELKGWSFINILLVLLLLSSCITSIFNFINGEIANGICCICCLCIFCWLYSYYNKHDVTVMQKIPNIGDVNIRLR